VIKFEAASSENIFIFKYSESVPFSTLNCDVHTFAWQKSCHIQSCIYLARVSYGDGWNPEASSSKGQFCFKER